MLHHIPRPFGLGIFYCGGAEREQDKQRQGITMTVVSCLLLCYVLSVDHSIRCSIALEGIFLDLNTNISDLRIACSKELTLCHGRDPQPVACRKADLFAIDNGLAFAGKNTVDFLICLVGVDKRNICSRRNAFCLS